MNVIDEEGRLFGTVNVVDALVVLVVVAVVAAGAAFVLAPEPEQPEPATATTNATLDLGTQPNYIAASIQEGDSFAPAANQELTVTEMYLAPSEGGTRVVLGVELQGLEAGDSIDYDGAPPRLGRSLTIQTESYQTSGTIRGVGETATLDTTSTEVLTRTTLATEDAERLAAGQSLRVAGETVGTVEYVTTYGTDTPGREQVYVGLSLDTVTLEGQPYFGDTVVRDGATVPVETDSLSFSSEIQRIGATDQRGEPATREVTLRMHSVSPELAESVQVGMTESNGGGTVARLTSVERSDATVVVRSDDGNVYERTHPVQEDVRFTAELSVRETAAGPTFKGALVQQGSTVVLDLGTVTVEATVVAV